MKYFLTTVSLFTVLFLGGAAVSAQETQERVIDEVVAQVNEGVITLSRIKRETASIVDEQETIRLVHGPAVRQRGQQARTQPERGSCWRPRQAHDGRC